MTWRGGRAVLVPILVCAALGSAVGEDAGRERTIIDRDWKFALGDHPGAAAADFADGTWDRVGLPHSFSTPEFAASSRFYVGYGWYRRALDLTAAQVADRRVSLEFEGVFQDAEISVNGQVIAHHQGGYSGFSCDITAAAKPGRNLVAVRVDNFWNPRLAPRGGEHAWSGGIYRDVYLVITAPLHVAWCGTRVTTPGLSAESGPVRAETEVRNDGTTVITATVRSEVFAADGRLVASADVMRPVPPGETVVFDQALPPLAKPALWDPEHPVLYRLVSQVLDGARVVDRFETPFGFRWFAFTADQGFFLNGQHRYVRGANVHQDHAGWGDAVPNSGFVRDVRLVKEAGFDIIRGSHYPHDPAFAEACDTLGMLFWSENCYWSSGGDRKDGTWGASGYPIKVEDEAGFERSAENSLRDMIRVNRNHPSIVVWSMCNEPFFTAPETLPKAKRFLTRLVALSHELDPTRPAAIGGCQRGDTDRLGDIAGYNGDGAKLFIEPGIANVVSEYGSTISERPGAYAPGWGDLPQGGKQDVPGPYPWRYPWRSGEIIWCAFDHASNAGHDFGAMGFIDYFRLPKRQWFWYRNEYLHIPPPPWPVDGVPAALRLTSDTATLAHADGTCDAHLTVTVVDQAGLPLAHDVPVTLSIVSGPGELPTGPAIDFAPGTDIPIRDGQAAIEFHSHQAGTTVLRASSPGLGDGTVTIASQDGPAWDGHPAKVRPYVRFAETGAAVMSGAEQTYGLDNPTASSGDAAGHPSRSANDGDAATAWGALDADVGTWWQVDLERIVTVRQVQLGFPNAGDYQVRIDISGDGTTWTPLIDRGDGQGREQRRVLDAPKPKVGRFLRVVFTGLPEGRPAALAEFSATGVEGAP